MPEGRVVPRRGPEGGREAGTPLEGLRDDARDRTIVRASAAGIAGNVVLAAFKAFVGAITGSIAIVLDAVNNLSDAPSSLVTVIGTRLASRPADRRHPVAPGTDATMDAAISATILVAALVYLVMGARPEGWPGALISLAILKSGLEMLRETLSKVLGECVDADVLD